MRSNGSSRKVKVVSCMRPFLISFPSVQTNARGACVEVAFGIQYRQVRELQCRVLHRRVHEHTISNYLMPCLRRSHPDCEARHGRGQDRDC